mmetsp:Transcript_31529/g.76398  ORF Transcript_31529/g.76398 Transcript_31529/m.76398 type:complete len:572 (-) Transcript_31529:217-1932(-)
MTRLVAQRISAFAVLILNGAFSSTAFMLTNMPMLQQSSYHDTLTRRRVTTGGENIQELAEELQEPADKTIKSLQQLLQRQEADMETTKRLINSLERAKNFDPNNDDENDLLAPLVTMGFDYGFVSRSEGANFSEFESSDIQGYGPPANVWKLGWGQFWRNWNAIKGEYNDEPDIYLTHRQKQAREIMHNLTLDSDEIWKREENTGVEGPWIIKAPYFVICWLLDTLFKGKYVFSRFFLLETVARVPYFSYISMIHLYETLGFWRRSAGVKRIHFAEELNEFTHLQIAESLGGDQEWWVRFIAQHSAIVYFFVLCFLWLVSPSLSYEFSRLLETHAVHTYGQFLDENGEALKKLPPPLEAVEYYVFGASDPFYAEFQISSANGGEIRRPGESMRNLHDVYKAIQADEGDHVTAMKACLDPSVSLISPSLERRLVTASALVATVGLLLISGGDVNPDDIAVDASTMETFAGDGIVETVLSGLAAVSSQLMGDNSPEAVAGAESAVEGTELFLQASSIEKMVSAVAAGLASFFGISTLTRKREEDSLVENNAEEEDEDDKEDDDDSKKEHEPFL